MKTVATKPRNGMSAPPVRALVVFVEDHYVATPQGIFTALGRPYEYWASFLEIFDEVRPVARMAIAPAPEPGWARADGRRVGFLPVKTYRGLREIVRNLPRTWLTIARTIQPGDCFLVRGGGSICSIGWLWLKCRRIPFAREVLGNDAEGVALASRVGSRSLRRAVSRASHWLSRGSCASACCVNYVARSLAGIYPAARGARTYFVSDVEFGCDLFTGPRPPETFCADPLRLVSVGRMTAEKGIRELLQALKHLDDSGERRWSLDAIGPGPEQQPLQALAEQLGLSDRVTFPGMVPRGPDLFSRLDHADLYVLPSLTEGMPRAILEAMARGLPAIATRVGGLPDVLASARMVAPGDPLGLAELIRTHIGDRQRLAALSRDSIERVLRFQPDEMHRQKLAFWRSLRDHTERWSRLTGSNGLHGAARNP